VLVAHGTAALRGRWVLDGAFFLSGWLWAAVEKARSVTEERGRRGLAEVMGNITGTTTYEEFGDVDFMIEGVPEKITWRI